MSDSHEHEWLWVTCSCGLAARDVYHKLCDQASAQAQEIERLRELWIASEKDAHSEEARCLVAEAEVAALRETLSEASQIVEHMAVLLAPLADGVGKAQDQ